ncbi:hypothetical protein AMTRI_Chr12g240510 [Amborella trichopoda]
MLQSKNRPTLSYGGQTVFNCTIPLISLVTSPILAVETNVESGAAWSPKPKNGLWVTFWSSQSMVSLSDSGFWSSHSFRLIAKLAGELEDAGRIYLFTIDV